MTTLREDAERLAESLYSMSRNHMCGSHEDFIHEQAGTISLALQSAINSGAEKMRKDAIKICEGEGYFYAAYKILNLPLPDTATKK